MGSKKSRLEMRDKILKGIAKYRLIDNDFMRVFFEDKKCAKELLRIILQKEDIDVLDVKTEKAINVLLTKSVRMDILIADSEGRIYNIEIQKSDVGAMPKRARYNSSMIDVRLLNPGEEYSALPETYVIFITENDVLKGGKAIYHIDRYIEEENRKFNDGSHIVYVNLSAKQESELGDLLHDFYCTKSSEMKNPVLAERIKELKETKKGVHNMCEITEKLIEEAMQEKQKKLDEAQARAEAAEAKAAEAKAAAAAEAAEAKAAVAAAEAKLRERENAIKNAFRMAEILRENGVAEGKIQREMENMLKLAA